MDKPLDLKNVKIYTKADVIDAMNLIGQNVYMSDNADFEEYYKYTLIGIQFEEDSSYTFIGSDDCQRIIYKYFILEKDAKFKEEKEKELRPFKTIEEFEATTHFEVGDVVTIQRFDDEQEYEEVCVFSGYRTITTENPQIITLYFGNNSYSFDELKTYFNYYVYGEWYPFGIEE